MVTNNRSQLNPFSERGAALITALFVITILTILGVLVLNTSIVETKMAANQKVSSKMFYAAEAGLERGLKVMVADMEDDATANGPWGNLSIPSSAGSVTAALVNGATAFDESIRSVEMYRDGDNTSGVRKLTFSNGGDTVGNATYELYMYSPNNNEVYLLSYASGLNGVAAVEYHLDTDDQSPYNNAVFTGTGLTPDGGDPMNINIAGSVYSQGQVTLNGTSTVVNNYTDSACDASLISMLPANNNLDTKVTAKGGAVTLQGNSSIGSAGSNGAVSGIQADSGFNPGSQTNYVNNVGTSPPNIPMPGILGGLEAQYPGISSSPAYSGIVNETDRAMAIYTDLIRGLNGFAPGGTYADPNATVTTKGMVIDTPVFDCQEGVWKTGELKIQDCTADFTYQDSLGNGVTYNAASKTLAFTGMVMFSQEFEIKTTTPVTYSSQGSFIDSAGTIVAPSNQAELGAMVIAQEEIEIKTSFLPDNGAYLQGGTNTNSISFLGGQEIELESNGGGAVQITGFFYTPGGVEIEQNVQVAGTLIGGQFEVEGGNSGICQVPALKNYLPQYMPGTDTVLAFNSREWRRVY
ncbi:MAG: PilX N-terminal domain-containing pilus assembly protein [bacterium]